MSHNQKHGLTVEAIISKALRVPVASNPTSPFDIMPDNLGPGEAGSIKSVKTKTPVCLADARRMFNWVSNVKKESSCSVDPTLRIICVEYAQEGPVKHIFKVIELILKDDEETHKLFWGDLTLADINEFHDSLGLQNFPKGDHEAARKFAKAKKKELARRGGIIDLNPKIDSKSQRRLQCSLKLMNPEILESLKNKGLVTEYHQRYGEIELPIPLNSTARFEE